MHQREQAGGLVHHAAGDVDDRGARVRDVTGPGRERGGPGRRGRAALRLESPQQSGCPTRRVAPSCPGPHRPVGDDRRGGRRHPADGQPGRLAAVGAHHGHALDHRPDPGRRTRRRCQDGRGRGEHGPRSGRGRGRPVRRSQREQPGRPAILQRQHGHGYQGHGGVPERAPRRRRDPRGQALPRAGACQLQHRRRPGAHTALVDGASRSPSRRSKRRSGPARRR